MKLEKMFRCIHANSANLFHGRSPLFEICNDLILAQSMPSGAVHPNTHCGSSALFKQQIRGAAVENLRHAVARVARVARRHFRAPQSWRRSLSRPLNSSLTRHKASMGEAYMLAQKRLEQAFLCIIQTFVEWLGGIREFFKLDRDCFQLDRIRLELFSPFS